MYQFDSRLGTLSGYLCYLVQRPDRVSSIVSAMYREPLCLFEVLPLTVWCPAPHQRALPLLHSSYWLMRQTKTLSPASLVTIPVSLRRLLSAPAGRWPFPTLSPQSLHGCLDPYPAASLRCSFPVSSRRTSASPSI